MARPDTEQARLGQYMTPVWFAEALFERYYGHPGGDEVFADPTCGDGSFLRAVPEHVDAYGVEIDPDKAAEARANSGRDVVIGDFRTARLPRRPTHLIGNPPFEMRVVDGILRRGFEVLPWGGSIGFVLPCYAFQTASRVVEYAARWSLQTDLIPRNVWHGLKHPLVFAVFRKEHARTLVGLALYEEVRDVEQMPEPVREVLRSGKGSVWRAVCESVLDQLGGEAGLDAIYGMIEPKRPTGNPYWRAKVRQVLQGERFERTGRGRYRRRAAVASGPACCA